MTQEDNGWWCPTCNDWVSGDSVTYEEIHETCGEPVFSYKCACANLRDPETDIRMLVEATDQLIAETDVECDCVEAWASDVEPHMCAKHAAIEALKPFLKEKK